MGWQTQVVPQLQAGDTIINSSGTFVYSATPAAGNLASSVAPATGVDSFGNNYLDGVTSYGASIATQLVDGTITLYTGSLAAGWTQQAQIFLSGAVIELITSGGVITSNNTLDNGSGGATFNGSVTIAGTSLTVGNGGTLQNLILSPKMATPPNSPLSGSSTIAQIAAFCNSMVTSMQNHGMMT
jgi:hypothetical protein